MTSLDSALAPAALAQALAGAQPPVAVDVRSDAERQAEHVAGTLHVPLDRLEAQADTLPAGDLVLICRSGVRAGQAAQLLARRGRAARVLEGGLLAWRQAGLPLVEGRAPLPIDRQIQLVVGPSVLVSVILGVTVSPKFLGIAAFFGAGLTFAGVTGFCGLGLLLARMPWNRASAASAPACASPRPRA